MTNHKKAMELLEIMDIVLSREEFNFYNTFDIQSLKSYINELEESNKSKDLIRKVMTHDIINPLGIIRNYAEMMLEEKSSEDLKAIKRLCEKAIEILENVRIYEELEYSTSRKQFELTDPNKILKEVVDSLENSAEEKEIKIEYHPTEKTTIKTDQFLKYLFENLISNAIKYSPEGNNIVVSSESKNDEWLLSVKDNGVGVPDKYKEDMAVVLV